MYLKLDEIKSTDQIPDYYNFEKPCVIRGGCKSMKIFKEENILETLSSNLKNSILQTEFYNTHEEMENTDVKRYVQQPFTDTFHNVINNTKPYNYVADVDLSDGKNLLNTEFLKKFSLNIDNNRTNSSVLLFFGNNSRSGAHIHTGNDYILNQIYGKKTIYMFDYYDNPLDICPITSNRANFIKENIFQLDHSKLKIYKVDLNEGDSVTIPPWWWHAAQATNGVSMSITKTYDRSSSMYILKHPRIFLLICVEFIEGLSEKISIQELLENKELLLLIISIIILIIAYVYVR